MSNSFLLVKIAFETCDFSMTFGAAKNGMSNAPKGSCDCVKPQICSQRHRFSAVCRIFAWLPLRREGIVRPNFQQERQPRLCAKCRSNLPIFRSNLCAWWICSRQMRQPFGAPWRCIAKRKSLPPKRGRKYIVSKSRSDCIAAVRNRFCGQVYNIVRFCCRNMI